MDDTHYSFLVTQWLKLKYTFTVDSAWEHFLGKNIKQIGRSPSGLKIYSFDSRVFL